MTCHGTGAAGAPKFGDAAAWAPRIAAGYDEVLRIALTGKGAMPPRGGTNPDDYSDYEFARAVVYMANQGGAKFAEPAQPAANAASASGAAAASAPGASDATAANAQAAAAMAAIAALPKSGEAPAAGANAESSASAGKALYESTCQACHATGVLNAPKFGNKADWAPRLKDSMDVVYNFALHGKGAMPPKGGSSASDADVKAAVDYMVNAAK